MKDDCFRAQVKKYMRQRGYRTNTELAALLAQSGHPYNVSSVVKYLNGTRDPTPDFIDHVSLALNLDKSETDHLTLIFLNNRIREDLRCRTDYQVIRFYLPDPGDAEKLEDLARHIREPD